MTYYAAAKLAGTKYKIEARRGGPYSEVTAIYDGYYDSRHHVFSLYRVFVGLGARDNETPVKGRISAYDVVDLAAARERLGRRELRAEEKSSGAEETRRRRLPKETAGQVKIEI